MGTASMVLLVAAASVLQGLAFFAPPLALPFGAPRREPGALRGFEDVHRHRRDEGSQGGTNVKSVHGRLLHG